MIQILGYNTKGYSDFPDSEYVISTIDNPKSFDEFSVNIIDLSSKDIWYNKKETYRSLNIMNDFANIGLIMKNANKAKSIVVYPPNRTFYYDLVRGEYFYQIELKNMLSDFVSHIIAPAINFKNYSLHFENTTTKINGYDYTASFYFTGIAESKRKTISHMSEKTTTIFLEDSNLFLTTLNILDNNTLLYNYILEMGMVDKGENAPEWMSSIKMFDDEQQQETINKCNISIDDAKREIEKSSDILARNFHWKSILYTNGNQLVDVVFEMLTGMLDCDLTGFVDEKREDFVIVKEEITLVGEIKGVNSNVRSEHISQLEVNYQSYIEKLFEEKRTETVKPILIINHQRNKAPEQREPVHDNQIQLAIRNGSLIIESTVLLKMFEMHQNQHFSAHNCLKLLGSKTGILKIDDIVKF